MKEQYSIQLFLYPEHEKDIKKIIKKYEKGKFVPVYHFKDALSQYLKLKKAIIRYEDFLTYTLCDRHETNALKQISEMELIMSVITDHDFIELLVRNSLTNRILKACLIGFMSDELIFRIRECMVAYKIHKALQPSKT